MRLSEDEVRFLLWFAKLTPRRGAGDGKPRVDLWDHRSRLPFSEERTIEVSADLVDKGLLTATHQSFHWDQMPRFVDGEWRGGGSSSQWYELELSASGRAEVKRLRRWWRRLFRRRRAGQ